MNGTVELSTILIQAYWWYWKGWGLVPVQYDSKRIVKGFGVYQKQIKERYLIDRWFKDQSYNLAVVVPDRGMILDFDLVEVYKRFCDLAPDLAGSYTENTPRGGKHVFLLSDKEVPKSFNLIPGIEVKRLCLVYPSRVKSVAYSQDVKSEILSGRVLDALQAFVLPGTDSYPPAADKWLVGHPGVKNGVKNGVAPKSGLIADLKAKWSILRYLRFFEPKLKLKGRDRFYSGLCPWHGDHNPSLWVDAERGTWGCHSCGAHGDILNWHARRLGTSDIGQAAHDLKKYNISFFGGAG